jgi:hypothetical protein
MLTEHVPGSSTLSSIAEVAIGDNRPNAVYRSVEGFIVDGPGITKRTLEVRDLTCVANVPQAVG